jgi:hypothetical protein
MNMEIKPYEGIDKLRFGMTNQEIRKKNDFKVMGFSKIKSDTMLSDKILGKGIHIHYDYENRCEAIEFGVPSNPTYNGIHFIGVPFIEVKEKFIKLDSKVEIHETGFTSYKYGIGVYVSSLKESEHEPIEGVIIFKKGYYD